MKYMACLTTITKHFLYFKHYKTEKHIKIVIFSIQINVFLLPTVWKIQIAIDKAIDAFVTLEM